MSSAPRPCAKGLILAIVFVLAWTGAAFAQSISPSAVTIDQIDFRGGPNSVVGEITIDYGLAGGSGFVNVLNPAVPSDSGWLVRNLPVFDPSAGYDAASITTRLDLTQFAGANGTDVTSASLVIDYNPSPSATRSQVESHGASPQTFPVGSVVNATGGTGPGGEVVGYQAPPSLIDVSFSPTGAPLLGLKLQRKHPNVQAGQNQCAPAAVANSLQFIANTTPFNLPHPNIPGWGGDVPNNSLVGQLDVKTGRPLGTNRSTGNGGVWPMDGKLAYIGMNGLAPFFRIKHRVGGFANNAGTPLNGGADYTNMGVTSQGAGASFDVDWILTELMDGEDVEMDLHYQNGGRHYVEVTGGGRILGMPFLLHLSDSVQSDQDPTDTQGTHHVDFDWITNATGFAHNSNATIDQVISQSFGEVDYFPNTAAVFDLQGPSGMERIRLMGPSTVNVAIGPNGETTDSDGGLDLARTEMVQLDLTGSSPSLGPISLKLRDSTKDPFQRSSGEIKEISNTMTGRLDVPPFAPTGTATSYFDVFFEVTVNSPIGPIVLHNKQAKHVHTTIQHKPPATGDTYVSPDQIQLYTEDNQPSPYQIVAAYHVPNPENVPPICNVSVVYGVGADVTIQDTGTGLATIQVTQQKNATVDVPSFPIGDQDPVHVTASKQTPGMPSEVELTITDVSGNVTVCDPVLTLQVRDSGKPVDETLNGLSATEHLVTIANGSPGLKSLRVTVNGQQLMVAGLKDGETRTLDVSSAMHPGNGNVIVLTPEGKPGGSAEVAIHN